MPMPSGVKARIVSVKPDHKVSKAGIRVKVLVDGQERTKDFLVNMVGNTINFNTFKVELEKSVKVDLDREALERASLVELNARIDQEFELFDYLPPSQRKKKRGKV